MESSFWLLPAGHSPHLDTAEEMAGIVRTCLEVGIPAPEDENVFMRELARNRTATSPVYVGRTIVEDLYYESNTRIDFPGSIEYSPDGYPF